MRRSALMGLAFAALLPLSALADEGAIHPAPYEPPPDGPFSCTAVDECLGDALLPELPPGAEPGQVIKWVIDPDTGVGSWVAADDADTISPEYIFGGDLEATPDPDTGAITVTFTDDDTAMQAALDALTTTVAGLAPEDDTTLLVDSTNPVDAACNGASWNFVLSEPGSTNSGGAVTIPQGTNTVAGLMTRDRDAFTGYSSPLHSEDLKAAPVDTEIFGPVAQATITNPDACRPMRVVLYGSMLCGALAGNGPAYQQICRIYVDRGDGALTLNTATDHTATLNELGTIPGDSLSSQSRVPYYRVGALIPPSGTITLRTQVSVELPARFKPAVDANERAVTAQTNAFLMVVGESR